MVIRERGRYGECKGYREEAVVMDRKGTRDVQLLHRLGCLHLKSTTYYEGLEPIHTDRQFCCK